MKNSYSYRCVFSALALPLLFVSAGAAKAQNAQGSLLAKLRAQFSSAASNACDLNGDGQVNVSDVQLAVNQALNLAPCTSADLHMNNTCTVLDVQVVANAAVTGTCAAPSSSCVPTTTYPNTSWYPSVAPSCPPPLPPNPNAPSSSQDTGPIHPCMEVENGVRYQAIQVSGVSGQLNLNAELYEGTGCDPNSLVDSVPFGQTPFFGTTLYWLIHFWDEPNTSAIWTLGNVTTSCIDYSKVADCS